MNTHGMIVDFGRYKGKLYTRIPVSYLKWVVQSGHSHSDIARAEMERRGTVTPKVEVSGHAIDSASLRFRGLWHATAKNDNEGLHAWLVRMCEEALAQSKMNEEGIVYYGSMKMVFDPGEWPVLKTVMPYKTRKETLDDIKAKVVIKNGRDEFIKPGKSTQNGELIHHEEEKTNEEGIIPHIRNFVDCIRTRNKPNADVELGHISATLCHLGNIVVRTGRNVRFDPAKETIPNDPEASKLLTREYRDHWSSKLLRGA